MKVVQLSSHRAACGIAVYTEDLAEALRRKGVETHIINSAVPAQHWGEVMGRLRALVQGGADILHVQYETLISGPWDRLRMMAAEMRGLNPRLRVFVTLHRTGTDTVNGAQSIGDVQIIVSQDHTFHDLPNMHIATMGCPVYPERDRVVERARLNIPERALVLSTFGFLVNWKRTNEVVRHLIPHLQADTNLYLQLLCAYNSFAEPNEGPNIAADIMQAVHHAHVQDRVHLITDFLSREEVNRRLSMADVGFLYAPIHTGSTSAANKDFVSARLPLVLSDSNHHWDIRQGVIRSPGLEVAHFASHVVAVARDQELRARLKNEMKELYNTINWDRSAERHIELYGKVLVPA
jgi:glycosyltransferase involved in cell wall biosynthesis